MSPSALNSGNPPQSLIWLAARIDIAVKGNRRLDRSGTRRASTPRTGAGLLHPTLGYRLWQGSRGRVGRSRLRSP